MLASFWSPLSLHSEVNLLSAQNSTLYALCLWKCFQWCLMEIKEKKSWSFPFPPSLGGCCKDDIARLNLIYRLNLQKIILKGTEGHIYLSSFCSICSVYSLFRDVYLTAFNNPDFSMFMFCISFHLFSCSFIFSFSTFFPDTLWLIVFKHLNLSFPNHRNKLTLYKPPIPLSLWLYFLTKSPLCLIFYSTIKN